MAEVTILSGGGVAGATISGAQTSIDPKTTIGSGTTQNPVRAIGIVGMPDAPGLSAAQKSAQLRAAEPGLFGMPITATGHLAKADTLGGSMVVGVLPGNAVAAEVIEYTIVGALIALALSTWDAVTDQSGGLSPGEIYYLSAVTAGHMTTTPPTTPGHYVVPIGIAISPTTLVRVPAIAQIVGGGASNPTTERIVTHVNTVAASPAVDVSFCAPGNDADGSQNVTLANGSIDGFEKTINCVALIAGVPIWRIEPASGPQVNIGNDGGSVTYRWDADAVAWTPTATFNKV